MKRQISLKWFLILSFLAVTILLVAGYTVLSLTFFRKGLDNATSANLIRSVERYVASVPAEQRHGLRDFGDVQIASGWEWMPEDIRERLQQPAEEGVLHALKHGQRNGPPEQLDFVMLVRQEGEPYFVRQFLRPEMFSPLVGRQAVASVRTLFGISALSLLFLCGFAWLLFNKVARPGRALSAWAASLDEQTLRENPPDFYYPELNKLAGLIRNSLLSVRWSLDREQLFLRYSSHELRTPISVIRANVELLQKIESCDGIEKKGAGSAVIERIGRAAQTMQHLVETLLWLGRNVSAPLPAAEVDVEQLLREVVEEAKYLLHGKNIDLSVDTAPCTVSVPETACRIVMGNLVRNAFQHTRRGAIHIVQYGGKIEVINYMAEENDVTKDIGFGLGLQLVERLADKLGWTYRGHGFSGGHSATLSMDVEEESPAGEQTREMVYSR